jgi:hypothetical protein
MTTTMAGPPATGRTPWHLWAVGLVGLLWNGFGAYDYLMTQTRGDAYLREMGMTDPQITYFQAMPAWMDAVWAIGVWGALLGTVLLLTRSRWAAPVFALSLAAFVMSLIYAYLLSNGSEVMGSTAAIMNLVVLAGVIFFAVYSWWAAKRGWLR